MFGCVVQTVCMSFIFSFLFLADCFSEGLRRDSLVLTPVGSQRIDAVIPGMDVYCFDKEGKLAVRPVTHVESFDTYKFFALKVKGGEIFLDAEQAVFSPKKNNWVKAVELDPQIDSVLTNLGEVSPIQGRRKLMTYLADIPVTMYKISVKDYENFFVSSGDIVDSKDRQYVLVHNFVPIAIPLSAILVNAAVDLGIAVAVGCVADFVVREVASGLRHVRMDTGAKASGDCFTDSPVGIDFSLKKNGSDDSNIDSIDGNKVGHILDSKHGWDKVVPGGGPNNNDPNYWEKVKDVIKGVLAGGVVQLHGEKAFKTAANVKGHVVEVTYKVIDGVKLVSNAWVSK